MELNVNMPAYFSQRYGIDNEVYRFCHKVMVYFKDKEYSDTLHTIGIVPVAAPHEIYDNGEWKESVRFICNKSCAAISIRMDFEEYYHADSAERIRLTKMMILNAVKKIKSKGKFDYDAFERDFDEVRLM